MTVLDSAVCMFVLPYKFRFAIKVCLSSPSMNEIPNFCVNIKNEVTRIFLKASRGPEPVPSNVYLRFSSQD